MLWTPLNIYFFIELHVLFNKKTNLQLVLIKTIFFIVWLLQLACTAIQFKPLNAVLCSFCQTGLWWLCSPPSLSLIKSNRINWNQIGFELRLVFRRGDRGAANWAIIHPFDKIRTEQHHKACTVMQCNKFKLQKPINRKVLIKSDRKYFL